METSNRDWTVSRSYRLWEQWEVDQLVSMWREGATSRQIANMIGRTPAQVRSFVKNNPMTFEKVKEEVYDQDYYYLPKYHWLITKSWSST